MVASTGVQLSDLWLEDGTTYWLEARPAEEGRCVVVRGDPWSAPSDVTPEGFNARTKVHEYGGGSFWVRGGTVFFANFTDQRLHRQDPGSVPVPITPNTAGRHRYADGRVTTNASMIVCVRERHEGDSATDVVNELVAIPTDGAREPQIVAAGRDFYSSPRISPDGAKLCWLEWDLAGMPWDGTEVWVAELAPDATIADAHLVAGGPDESIFQPSWSPAGELHFVSDRTNWWNIYRVREGIPEPLYPAESEFGWPQWLFGYSAYAFLADGRIACMYGRVGVQHIALLDGVSGELLDLDLPYSAISDPYIVAEGEHIAFIGSSPTKPAQVVSLDFASRSVDVLRESQTIDVDAGYLSLPEPIEFSTDGGLTAHAHFYPPANKDFAAEAGELPPVIVATHGGPTSEATADFDLRKQFFTSRGFAVVDVNYGGSTGYGREYRQRLAGNWGIVDTADCINAAKHLVAKGLVDPDRLAIRGGSAGGYTTLCALTFHDEFAVGASWYGISDLEPFAVGGTHKFESRYEVNLVGPYPEAADTYRARSPIHFVDRLSCPMLLLQGDEDEVVPPAQAELMARALDDKGLPYACILFEGEQHGFRKSDHIERAFAAELSFYAQILGFELGHEIDPVEISNLGSNHPGRHRANPPSPN